MYNDTIFSHFSNSQFLVLSNISAVITALVFIVSAIFMFVAAKDSFDRGEKGFTVGYGLVTIVLFGSLAFNVFMQNSVIVLSNHLLDENKKVVLVDANTSINIKNENPVEKTIVFPDGDEIKLISPPINNKSKVSSDWKLRVKDGNVIIEKTYNF